MNSRSAAKEQKPKSRMTPALPPMKATASSTTITHHARMRSLRFSIDLLLPSGDRPPLQHIADGGSGDEDGDQTPIRRLSRSGWMLMPAPPSWCGPERQKRIAGAGEKGFVGLVPGQLEHGAEGHAAHQRHRNELALGHHPVEVVDPDRHELELRPRARRGGRARLLKGSSGSSVSLRVPSGKRMSEAPPSTASCMISMGSRVRVSRSRSIRTALNTSHADETPQPGLQPVVGAGDGPRPPAQPRRQHRSISG